MFKFLLILPGLLAGSLYAQNLVPNPSFESYQQIPCSWNTVASEFSQYTDAWYIPANTSTDIHNTHASPGCWANPLTVSDGSDCRLGTQQPHSGDVMAGIYTIVSSHVWHEYLQVKLTKPLIPGQHYCVEMWVSAADNVALVSNNIGMYFSVDPIRGEDQITGVMPQINAENVIRDSKGWTLIGGSFIAETAAEYLTIGNFFSDKDTKTEPMGGNGFCSDGAYYYIDDVVVMLCPV